MQRIENIRASWTDSTGVRHVVADLQVSTADELPALGGNVGVNVIEAGTIAQVIQAGGFVTLDDDGNWYDTDGIKAGSVSASVSTRSAAPPNIEPVVMRKFVPDPETENPEVVEDAKR